MIHTRPDVLAVLAHCCPACHKIRHQPTRELIRTARIPQGRLGAFTMPPQTFMPGGSAGCMRVYYNQSDVITVILLSGDTFSKMVFLPQRTVWKNANDSNGFRLVTLLSVISRYCSPSMPSTNSMLSSCKDCR